MPISREKDDAWWLLLGVSLGETKERIDLLRAEADALDARLEAQGRGSSARWPSVSSSSDTEFDDYSPMTPPMTPPWASSGNPAAQSQST